MADEIVRARFEAETSGYVRGVETAAKATDKLATAADKTAKATSQSGRQQEKAAQQAARAQDKAADAAGRLRVAQEKLNQARASKDVGRIVAAEENVAKAQRDVERTAQEAAAAQNALQAGIASSGDSAGASASKFDRLSDAVKANRDNMEQAGGALVGFGTVLTGASVGMGKAAMDWESSFAGVKKTVDDTTEGYAQLSDELRGLATTLPTTHTEVAAVAEAAGQLGVAREDIVGFTATMIDLGETTNLTADEAATNIAQISNVMGTMNRDGAQTLVLDKGADSVDFALANRVQPGDIVVTQDYGLASMCLAKGARVLHQDGWRYTEYNIQALLFQRHESGKYRRSGGRVKGPRKRTKQQDKDFEAALQTLLQG